MKHKKPCGLSIVLAAVTVLSVLAACSSGSDYTPDNPGESVMSRQTADGIFDYSIGGGGVIINNFKSEKLLAAWLLEVDAASSRAAVTVQLPDTFTIPKIDNIPVVGIGAKAFAAGVGSDISAVVAKIALPETIRTLGSDLFAGVKTQITVTVPPAVLEIVGKDAVVAAAGTGGVAKVAATTGGGEETVIVPASIPAFDRSKNSGVYTLASYDGENARLAAASGSAAWYKITDANLKALFSAIYEPNKPGSVDSVESGKTAVKYTDGISAAALNLFKITIGTSTTGDKVELKGTTLPGAEGASAANLIVIDIGKNDNNSGLPTFYIPKGKVDTLGLDGYLYDYSHIRLRVNNGAELVILADNSGYLGGGAGNPCPEGNFKGGAVEVLSGGKLRDGAYEGFPLGSGAVIVNRAGSYLSVGPEPTSDDASSDETSAYQKYYSGWLIGPASSGARVEWEDANGYIEVRSKELITSAKLTVKKNMGLIYSVWFLPGSSLNINISGNDGAGLYANEVPADYNFYVVNPSDPGSNFITVTNGNFDKRFLINGAVALQTSHIATREAAFGSNYYANISARYGTTQHVGYLIKAEEE